MSPASVQGDSGLLFKLVICSIPVSLDIAFIAAQQLVRHACGTAVPVIIDHDITAQAVKDAPFITFSDIVFLIVYDRYGTLVHMDILALEYLLPKDVIQELEPFDRRLVPVSHRGVTYRYPSFLVLLYLAVEREMIHELSDHYVSQYRSTRQTSRDRQQGKICNQDFPVFRQVVFNVGVENNLVSYSAVYEYAGCNHFKSPDLFSADLDIFRFELAGLVTSAVWVDVGFNNFQFAVVKRIARRLCLSGYSIGDGILSFLDIGFEGSPLAFALLLLVEQQELGRIKREMFFGRVTEYLIEEPRQLIIELSNDIVFVGHLLLEGCDFFDKGCNFSVGHHLFLPSFPYVDLVKINDIHKLMAAFLRYPLSFLNSSRRCRRPSFFSTIPSTISTMSLHSIVPASSSLLDMVGCPKVPASSSLE